MITGRFRAGDRASRLGLRARPGIPSARPAPDGPLRKRRPVEDLSGEQDEQHTGGPGTGNPRPAPNAAGNS